MLKISIPILEEIKSEAKKIYPYECCGLMLGTEEKERIITELLPINNSIIDNQSRRRFSITAEDFLKAELLAATKGLSILGIYHSHPDHKAVPSDFDRECALPFYSYLIVSVEQKESKDVTSWLLSENRISFIREDILELS